MAAGKKSKGTVGVIGLGIMGGAFAKNLAAAGWRVTGYDPSPKRRREAERAGVTIARNAAEVARAAPTLLTSLPKPQALMDTARAIAAAKLKGKVIVELSTFAIADKQKAQALLAKAGHIMLDCPVSGTGAQAVARDLVFYASGDARAIRRLQPMFAVLRPPRLQCRRLRQRQQNQICRQPAGGDPQRRQRRSHGAGHEGRAAAATDLRPGAGRRRQFAHLRIARADDGEGQIQEPHHEDRRLGQGHAGDRRLRQEIRAPTPLFDVTKPLYVKAAKSGYGAQDTAAVCAVLEKMAKVKRKR